MTAIIIFDANNQMDMIGRIKEQGILREAYKCET